MTPGAKPSISDGSAAVQLPLPFAQVLPRAEVLLRDLLGDVSTPLDGAPQDGTVEALAQALHVEVKSCAMTTMGQLLYSPVSPVVLLQEKMSNARRRFTLAHELAHFLVHRSMAAVPNGDCVLASLAAPAHAPATERLMDRLGARALLPKEMFVAAVADLEQNGKRGMRAATALKERFKVSLTVVLARLADVRPDYLSLGCSWRATVRHPEALRIDWAVADWSSVGFIARNKGLPSSGPIADAFWTRKATTGRMRLVAPGKATQVVHVEAVADRDGALVLVHLASARTEKDMKQYPALVLTCAPWRRSDPPPRESSAYEYAFGPGE